eukprot:TRINITY_DN2369_c0_g1_i2.p1 TRINITY_DN2369_c0_g1~~TRINITY_DN2369_c0_g1_i2.p1  ORF type:complete len:232 (+),score=53.87 TRINITY_DN2369_c0_g1_i2:58-753(+)
MFRRVLNGNKGLITGLTKSSTTAGILSITELSFNQSSSTVFSSSESTTDRSWTSKTFSSLCSFSSSLISNNNTSAVITNTRPQTSLFHSLTEHSQSDVITASFPSYLDINSSTEMFELIRSRFKTGNAPRLGHLHHQIRLANTAQEVANAMTNLERYRRAFIPTTSETATLMIKACMRANRANWAVDLVSNANKRALTVSSSAANSLLAHITEQSADEKTTNALKQAIENL